MSRHRHRRSALLAAALAVSALALASCGSSGDDGDGDEGTTTEATATTEAGANGDEGEAEPDEDVSDVTAEDYTAALQSFFTTGVAEDGDLVLADGEAECVAPQWVEAIGVEAFHEAGTTTEALADPGYAFLDLELDGATAQAMIDAFDGCGVDIYGQLASSLTLGLTDEQQACAVEEIDPELANALLLTAFSSTEGDGSEAFDALLTQLQTACDLPG